MKVFRYLAVLLLVAIYLTAFHGAALAHGHTEVGEYELVIGFHVEPAYQGEPNGLDLFVTNHASGEPVNGLEETLQVEIVYGSAKKVLEIEPQFGQEGAYTAQVIPTAAGDYTWHIFGMIESTPVDVSMTSSPDTFGAVEAKSSAAFPAIEPDLAVLESRLAAADGSARTALLIGAAGAVLGLAGLAAGLMSWSAARRIQPAGTAGTARKAL